MPHAKSDSEVTSIAASTPPRSPRPGPVYYVVSPSHPDTAEKMMMLPATSLGSSPATSPYHHRHYHYHSRESSTGGRFSASLKNMSESGPWKKLDRKELSLNEDAVADGDEDDDDEDRKLDPRCYVVCFFLGFFLLFTLFSLILWASSKAYRPQISVDGIVFDEFNIQAGMDVTGVPTKMLSINSTVKLTFRNPATFFGVHVTLTPLELYYFQLKIASGPVKKFYLSRESGRVVRVEVGGTFVPLYGGGSTITSKADGEATAVVPVILSFVVRSRAYVLGKLVKSKFLTRVRCEIVFKEARIGKRMTHLQHLCRYRH